MTTTPRLQLTLTLLLAAITLTPIALLQTPFLGDTLNHLARMHILAAHTPNPFYEIHWQPIPYLAMDAILPPLLHILPLFPAARLFLAACLILPPLAATALHYTIHRRPSLLPATAFLLSYNQLASLGFLNFLFSASLAVLLLAAWIATQNYPRWPRALAFTPLVTALYFGHVFACLAYCLAIAGYESAAALRTRPTPATIANLAAALLPAIPAIILAATIHISAGYIGPLHTIYGTPADKLVALTSPILFHPNPTNAATLATLLILTALTARHLRLAPTLWPPTALLFACSLAIPHLMASTWGTDLRLPFVATLLLIAALSWRPPTPRLLKPALAATLLVLTTAKSLNAYAILATAQSQITQTRAILTNLPPATRLLVVNAPRGATLPPDPSTQWSLPMVAIIDRDAFLPTLFTGLSTVHVRPPYIASSTPNGPPITPAQLRAGLTTPDTPNTPDGPGGGRLYHLNWPAKFDYLLIQRFGTDPGPLPPNLTPVAHSPDMDLYKIKG